MGSGERIAKEPSLTPSPRVSLVSRSDTTHGSEPHGPFPPASSYSNISSPTTLPFTPASPYALALAFSLFAQRNLCTDLHLYLECPTLSPTLGTSFLLQYQLQGQPFTGFYSVIINKQHSCLTQVSTEGC